jgi:hypothetical protein
VCSFLCRGLSSNQLGGTLPTQLGQLVELTQLCANTSNAMPQWGCSQWAWPSEW